jgi:hypothetical protein
MRACELISFGLFFVGVDCFFPRSFIGFLTFGPEMHLFNPFFLVPCLSWRV